MKDITCRILLDRYLAQWLHHLPFPFAETEDELVGCIQAFDWKRYEEQLNTFFEPMELSAD